MQDATRPPLTAAPPGRYHLARLLLRLTTARWAGRPHLPHDVQVRLARAVAAGWTIRVAAPRYHAVWEREIGVQRALRVLVLPSAAARLGPAELRASIAGLAHCLGLPGSTDWLAAPGPANAARRKMRAALAPGWLGVGAMFDIVSPAPGAESDGLADDVGPLAAARAAP